MNPAWSAQKMSDSRVPQSTVTPPVPPSSAASLRRVAALFIGVGALGWAVFTIVFRNTPGQDWMVFDTAVQAWRHGDIALLLDGPRFTAVLNATHADWLRDKLVFHPWVYPPFTLLLALPFGLLPFGLSYYGFQVLSFAALAAALRPWAANIRAYLLLLAGVVLCPATAFTLGAGQNSFFTASLFLGGIFLVTRRPAIAGVLLGLLAFKPQFAVLAPVALLALGAWIPLATAAATVAALLLLSLIVPGPALWAGWLHLFLSGDPAFHTWVNEGRINGQSVFSCLALLGVPGWAANAGQLAAMAFAAICVWLAFRRFIGEPRRLAVLLCATILAAPHVGSYDGLLLGIAALLVLLQGLTQRLPAADIALAAALWISTAVNPPHLFALTIPPLFYVSVLTPLIAGAFMVRCLRQGRTSF
jgi:hypothetical protein